MSIYIGNTKIGQIYLGSTKIAEAYLGSTKVYQNGLPYDAQIEYLESTGTQFIKTNINGNARIIGCAQSSSIKGSSTTLISSSNLGTSGCWYGEAISTTKWGIGGEEDNYSNVLSTTKATFDIDFGATEITGTVNAESISRTIHVNRSEWSIFACSTGNYAFSGKVFFIKIYKDNILVRDFIPVRVGNVGYLFDNVSKELFGNTGTGSFTLGPDIVPIEYLQSSGTQYIDTGITPNDYTKVECTIYSSTESSWYVFGARDLQNNTIYFAQSGSASNSTISCAINGAVISPGWNRLTDGASLYNIILESNNTTINYFIQNVTLNKSYSKPDGIHTLLGDNIPANIYILALKPNNIIGGTSRIYSFKITKNGTLVRDFIPVRIGTTGYMYDKVSRQLFGNSGTGDFILGNDI